MIVSNLGWYQIITTAAKKVGGPKNLIGLIFGGGTIVGGGVVAGVSAIKKKVVSKFEQKESEIKAAIIHTVKVEGKCNEGLAFSVGDQYRILELDGDAALIEKIGDKNNPYFVSAKFLNSIS